MTPFLSQRKEFQHSMNCLIILIIGTLYFYSLFSASRHVKSSILSGVLQSTWRAVKSMQYQGDMMQQGGQFIVGPGKCRKNHVL